MLRGVLPLLLLACSLGELLPHHEALPQPEALRPTHPRAAMRALREALTPPPHPPVVLDLHLGEKTTCLTSSDGAFRCFGALATHGAAHASLEVTDAAVCGRDGQHERCHAEGGHVAVRDTPFVDVEEGSAPCGLDRHGEVWCWRSREQTEQITPIPIGAPSRALVASAEQACALTRTGELRCFDPARHVYGFGRPPALAARRAHLVSGSYLQHCWATERSVACSIDGRRVRVRAAGRIRALAAGLHHGCLVDDHGIRCWGSDRFGQRRAPRVDPDLVLDLAAGDDHTCVLTFGGRVRCWGRDDRGQVSTPCDAGMCG